MIHENKAICCMFNYKCLKNPFLKYEKIPHLYGKL